MMFVHGLCILHPNEGCWLRPHSQTRTAQSQIGDIPIAAGICLHATSAKPSDLDCRSAAPDAKMSGMNKLGLAMNARLCQAMHLQHQDYQGPILSTTGPCGLTCERQRPLPRLQLRQRSRMASQMRCSRLLRRCQCHARQAPAIISSSSTAPIAGQARPSADPLPNGLYSVLCGERPSVSAVTSRACRATRDNFALWFPSSHSHLHSYYCGSTALPQSPTHTSSFCSARSVDRANS